MCVIAGEGPVLSPVKTAVEQMTDEPQRSPQRVFVMYSELGALSWLLNSLKEADNVLACCQSRNHRKAQLNSS